MLRQFLFGFAVSIGNIVIHALVMATVVRVVQIVAAKDTLHPTALLIAVMVAAVSVFMGAHACEVAVWALAYALIGATPPDVGRMYFAFVNYTTLGYGDILPVQRWQLLGPMTAMNGVLLFGWSTAVIFEILRRATSIHSPGATNGR